MASNTPHDLLLNLPFCVHIYAQLKKYRLYKGTLPIERLLYYQGYLFYELELYVRYDRWVLDLNTHHNNFLIRHFVCTYTRNSKLQVIHVYGRSTYQITALLSKMSIFCVRAGCEINS